MIKGIVTLVVFYLMAGAVVTLALYVKEGAKPETAGDWANALLKWPVGAKMLISGVGA